MLGIGVVASILGIAAGLLIDWFPVAASEEAKPIDTLWDVLIIASVPVFVGVSVVVLFSVVKFRMRPGEEELDGPPIHGNTKLEVVWTAIPAILLVGLCTYAFIVLTDVEKAQANTMEVRVVGEQFAWTFFYPGEDGKEISATELHLPIDRPVKFTLQAKDVLHDFWIPAFRMKKDAVPGINVTYRVTPNRLGEYPIVCAELCGLGHATMRATAVVQTEADFASWLEEAAKPPAPPAGGGGGDNGKGLFTSNGCGGCHTLADAGTNATVGPNLDEVLAGKDEAFIKTSIEDPSAEIANGYSDTMPKDYGQRLGADGVDALAKYLSEVTKEG
ncbi:cytochrome c oxidase subunit II [Solirubrobacter phytolaccae]|uniref:Cytochrome c oxidase subunit 2 n=1 Tax=Solirubrobacter phytolaccae TaxID=1404360 RepID=A0A9X3N7P3_9ACTN|nr:cytochrome c oxidase subunit II [Solirubrobacter phytolaccae]MDA0179904.1 cytochrome c oxidase subunit II [Solirubrobacter phytolaccae]